MKIFHHILMIAFVGFVLFFIKDDIKSVYIKAVTYLKDNKITSTNFISKIIPTESVVSKARSVLTPGALKVTDEFLGSGNTVLSGKGVINWTNSNREANGDLHPLKENTKLNTSAQKKVQDMFAKQYFEHVSPSGVGVADLGTQVGYQYIIIGENLALGNFKDDKALVDAWMASPGHRANILNTKYTEIGVAVGKGMYNGRQTWLAVQHFGLPRSVCPTLNEALHVMIESLQIEAKDMEVDLATRKQDLDSGAVRGGYTHNEQVDQYNALVEIYNKLNQSIKEKVIEYNAQVRALNDCIANNT